jgi:hypothetical protein
MKKTLLILFVLFGLYNCSDTTTAPSTATDPDPDLKLNPLVRVPTAVTAEIGEPESTHTFRLDSFQISTFEIMNHEYCEQLLMWVDYFPAWDTVTVTGDTTVLISRAMLLHTDTVFIKLGDSTKPIIVLNPTALAFEYDTTFETTGDATNAKTTKRIKPSLSWSGDYRNHPVQGVSWYGASLFCWLKTKNEKLFQCIDTAGLLFNLISLSNSGYRLPTEAEWEWTARDTNSGDNAYYPTGSSISAYRARIGAQSAAKTGSFMANSRGIYDLAGNLWEWCLDSYSAVFYTSNATSPNPVNVPSNGVERVIRGGSFNDSDADVFRTARRSKMLPLYMGEDAGFRVVRR